MPALINTVCSNVIEIVLNKFIHYVLDDVVWSIKEKIYVRQCNEKNFFCFEVDARCKLFMLHFYQPSSLLSTLNFIYGVVCRGLLPNLKPISKSLQFRIWVWGDDALYLMGIFILQPLFAKYNQQPIKEMRRALSCHIITVVLMLYAFNHFIIMIMNHRDNNGCGNNGQFLCFIRIHFWLAKRWGIGVLSF